MSRITKADDDDIMEKGELTPLAGQIKILTQTKTTVPEDPLLQEIDMQKMDQLPEGIQKVLSNKMTLQKAAGSNYTAFTGNDFYGLLEVAEPSYNLDYLAKLYDTNSFHAAAIDAKIDNTVGLGYYFDFTRKAQKLREESTKKSPLKKRRTEVALDDAKEQLIELLESFNDRDQFEQTLEKFFKDRLTMGNAYLEIGRDENGRVAYLGHIPAKAMRIRKARDGYVQFNGATPVFFRNFGDTTTPDPFGLLRNPNEIIHYMKYSPTDEYYGVPEIVSAAQAVAGVEFAQRYNIDYFENKAVPRYVIKTKGLYLDDGQQAEMLKYFENTIKGVNHRTILVPIPGGPDKDVIFEPVEAGQQDSSYDAYVKLNIQIILSRHRVPQARIGLSTAASSQSESKESERTFKEAVCRPEQRIIEKKLNKLFGELTDIFRFKLKEYSLTDEQIQSEIDERHLRWGVKTPNEVRETLGLQPRQDGDGDEPLDQRTLMVIGAEQAQTAALAQQKAEAKSQAYQNRTRDQNRTSDTSDSVTSTGSRNAQGEGRKTGK